MSHGSSGGDTMQINMTPLLDVVLQLLMFFMMCVNFVTEQVNETIVLPESLSARPMDSHVASVLFLNLDLNGHLVVPGKDDNVEPMMTGPSMFYYLRTQFEDASRLKGGDNKVDMSIVIRADQRASYKQVFDLLELCKRAKFTKLQLRATTKAAERTDASP